MAEEEAKRRASREGIEQAEREAAEARRKAEEERHRPGRGGQAQGRTRSQEAFRRSRGAARAAGDRCHARACAPAHHAHDGHRRARGARRSRRRRAPVAAEAEEDEGPRQIRRGPGGAMRPVAAPKTTHKPAPQKQRGRLTLVTALNADDVRERSIASFRRRTQRLKGHAVERAEGKADPRSHHSGSHHDPGTRQPHVRARGRRHPPADEAGRDAQDHRRDRCRHRAADRRGIGPHRQARGRVRRRGRPVRHRRRFHRHRAALAGRDRDGPRRPRQDLAARRAAPRQRGVGRSRRHHPAYRRLSGDRARERQEDHLHRHARPRRVHRDARPRRQGHRHRGAGGRGRRRRDAADGRSDQSRQGREGSDDRRDQQDRQAGRQARARAHRAAAARGAGRIARRRRRRRRGLRQEQDQSRPPARNDRAAGRYPRPQDQFGASGRRHRDRGQARSRPRSGRDRAGAARHAAGRRHHRGRRRNGPRPRADLRSGRHRRRGRSLGAGRGARLQRTAGSRRPPRRGRERSPRPPDHELSRAPEARERRRLHFRHARLARADDVAAQDRGPQGIPADHQGRRAGLAGSDPRARWRSSAPTKSPPASCMPASAASRNPT